MEDYITSDIQIAAVLLSEGVELIKVEKATPRRAQFIFKNSVDIGPLVSGFWKETYKTAPLKFMRAYKELKNLIFN